VESAYDTMAETLVSACPPGFSKAWIEAKVGDDYSEKEIWFEQDGKKIQPDLDGSISFKLGRAMRLVRSEMTIPGQKPWSKCKFTLFPDGKFKFDVEYDD
jgi:hypothetical protein